MSRFGWSWKRFRSVLTARNKEFLRDHSALAWNFLFPVLIVLGFGFGSGSGSQDLFKVAGVGAPDSQVLQEFQKTRHIQWLQKGPEEETATLDRLRRHQVDLVLAPPARYWINESAPKGYLLEKLLKAAVLEKNSATSLTPALEKKTVSGREIRYVDWLVAGILAMNMMFSSLFGVGYVIVRYRKSGVLKRLKATPISPFEFLLAQVVSRLGLLIGTSVIVYGGCRWAVDLQMVGSYWDLLVVLLVGSVCMISIGLLVAARIQSEEFAGGLLNLLTWPMIFLSGVWFSLEGSPGWVQKLSQIFPLTHVIHAARSIMTEGTRLAELSTPLFALGGISIVCLVAGTWIFKWE